MTLRLLTLASATLLAGSLPARTQTTHGAALPPATDASWTREYVGNSKDIKDDLRFVSLMKASFPQHEYFARDHGRFLSLPELVMLYIGMPQGVHIDEDRYITAAGCMPHACMTRGMLWIDTATHPAKLIFVAQGSVNGSLADKGPNNMLWIFSSSSLNLQQQLPLPFLDSMHRWQNNLVEQDRKDHVAWNDEGGYLMANLVQPTGEIVVMTPSVLGLQPTFTGAKQ